MGNQYTNPLTKHHGYTLIEVLAALFIFVIIISIISFSFLQILKNVDIIKQKEERLSNVQTMLTLLQYDLSQAINKPQIAANQLRGSFYTQNNKLHFMKTGDINPNDEFNRSSIEEVVYYIENKQLIKLLKEDNDPTFKKQILLDGVNSFQYTFFDERFGKYSIWPPTQDWQYQTPTAVKIEINLDDMGSIEKIIDMAHHE